MKPLRIATRGSALARWQADYVARLLAPNPVEVVIVRTEGDAAPDASLTVIGGQGVFTKEIQVAVLRGAADIAVHSLKDLPTEPVDGLILAAVPTRGPTGDVLVSTRHQSIDSLPTGARIATGSVRRRALLKHRRPDLQLIDIRGNVDTRLRKLEDEHLDGLILAEAGLSRLGLTSHITEKLDPFWMVPAVGQGALGIECRIDDDRTRNLLQPLDDARSHATVAAERSFLRCLGGGCQVPIGANAAVIQNQLTLHGCILTLDGILRKDGDESGPIDQGEVIGRKLAQRMR